MSHSPQPRTAYLGPEGTYSFFTGKTLLPQAELVACKDFEDLFQAVANDDCRFGLVPLENSLRGSVGQCFDLFLRYDLSIVGESFSRISNCLLSREKSLSAIRTVHSHAQPLAQCSRWLHEHLPQARILPAPSTAAAAENAAHEPGAAALGHRLLAELHKLHILAPEKGKNLEEESENWTRFVVIRAPHHTNAINAPGPRSENQDKGWKSSFMFTVRDEPGSLATILLALQRGNINMRKLESRPMNNGSRNHDGWKYAFFVDVECDLQHPAHAAVQEELQNRCSSLRFLGTYPSGVLLDDLGTGSI